MPSRLKRYQTEGHHHFITFSCYRRLPKLKDDRARIVFEQILEGIRRRHRFFVFGYVLMPEHVHLLVSEPTDYPLATTLSVLKGETAKVLKQLPHPCAKKPRMNGAPQDSPEPFWQPRYYDFNVFTQVKFVEKLRYIHRNPVTRGLVEKPEDWPWSSFRHWARGETGRVEIESHWTWDRREHE
jgi:putative transposase